MARYGWTVGVAAVVLLGGAPVTAGAAASQSTTWRGWDLASDPAGYAIGANETVSAAGSAVLRVSPGRESGHRWFAFEDPEGTRVGELPSGDPTVAAADRIFLHFGCDVRRSTDRGATWTTVRLPGCGASIVSSLNATRDYGLLVTNSGTWGTDDGGAAWTRRGDGVAGMNGRTLLLGPGAALQRVSEKSGFGLARTADGGRTWSRVLLPGPPAAPAPPAPPTAPTPPPPTEPPTPPTEPPTPPTDPGIPPAPAPETPPTAELPALTVPARRADGAIVIGTAGAVLVSGDGGASFTRTALPEFAGGATATVSDVVCEPGGSCLLQIGTAATAFTIRFRDGQFPAGTLPALPQSAVAPLPDVVLGLSAGQTTLVRSGDAGATYAPIGGVVRSVPVVGRRWQALVTADRIRMTSDAGSTWTSLPPVEGAAESSSPIRFARTADGGYLALTENALHRYADGAWKLVADLEDVGPRSFALVGGDAIVVGTRGVVRVDDDGTSRPVSSSVLAGRAYRGVEARGRQVVAWSARQVVRSTDGGRRWRTVRVAGRGVHDLQLLGPTSYVAIRGGSLFRSTRNGRALRRAGTAPQVTAREFPGPSGLTFDGASRAVLHTASGTFRTDDGGRRIVPLPLPAGADRRSAVPFGRFGVSVRMFDSDVLLRTSRAGTTSAPRLTARRVGAVRRLGGGSRRVVISGRISGAPASAEVRLVGSRDRNDPGSRRAVTEVNADGTYRQSVTLRRGERLVRAWYLGAVTSRATAPAASSAYVTVPQRSPTRSRRRS